MHRPFGWDGRYRTSVTYTFSPQISLFLHGRPEAAERAAQADLIVLDVMLPGLDGFTVGKRLKKDATNVPRGRRSTTSSRADIRGRQGCAG
jgi:CheY-like chemotaxis protein